MDLITGLTGVLPFIVLVSAPLTALVSALLLWLYRRSSQRAMGLKSRATAVATEPVPELGGGQGPGVPLEIDAAPVAPDVNVSAETLYRRAGRSEWRAVLIYVLGGAVYALVLTIPWMATSGGGFSPGRLVWLLVCYLWPCALALAVVLLPGRRTSVLLAVSYFAVLAVAALFVLQRNPTLTVAQLAYFWTFANGAGTILLLMFAHRRIRSVGPMVLAFIVTGVSGAVLGVQFAGSSESLLRAIVTAGDALGLGATALFALMHVLGFAAFGLFGWWMLRWIGRRYRDKRISDQSMGMDAVWLLFAVVQSITLAFEEWYWVFAGLVAFVGYKLATGAGFKLSSGRSARAGSGPMLLLLRVFALGRRSERFFDVLSRRWRHAGSIGMIAGPDLITTTVEPHEFLEFLSGRHSRQFVRDEADLDRRVAALDRTRDPDGRYRVNEFFCHDDTWQMTMRRLAGQSSAVLMDLRSFAPDNQGCTYELGQLLNIVDLERVAFLVDESTDRQFLDETLQGLWGSVTADSPNRRGTRVPRIRLFQSAEPTAASLRSLLVTFLDNPAPL